MDPKSGEGRDSAEPLQPVRGFQLLTLFEAHQGEGGVRILVENDVVTVHVVRKTGDDNATRVTSLLRPRRSTDRGGNTPAGFFHQASVVCSVLDGKADPGKHESEQRSTDHSGTHHEQCSERKPPDEDAGNVPVRHSPGSPGPSARPMAAAPRRQSAVG